MKGSPTHANTTVRVENANAFAPLGEDPKELRKAHTQIKKNWYGIIHIGLIAINYTISTL